MRQLKALPGDIRAIARQRVFDLASEPHPSGSKELEGHATVFRLWLPRGHRLVYQVIEVERIIDLLYVGPKSPQLYADLGFEKP